MDEEEKIYQLSLNMIHGVGTQLWKNLITDLGGGEARNVFKAKKKDLYSYIKNDIIKKTCSYCRESFKTT